MIEDTLISLVGFCDADMSGVESDTTPHIYFSKESNEPSGIGKEAVFTVYIVSNTEGEGKGLYTQLEEAITKGAYDTFYFYRVTFDGTGTRLPDNRWMQEISLKILYEEAQ